MSSINICIVTLFPPQNGRLAEYADMLVSKWSENHKVAVICQSSPEPEPRDNIDLTPVFNVNKPLSVLSCLKTIHKLDADVVIFNQSIGVWGQKKSSNFAGMILPLLSRKLLNMPTFTILHNIYEDMNVSEIERASNNPVFDFGVKLATSALIRGSDIVSVTLRRYKETLEKEYGANNILHIPHGKPVNSFSFSYPDQKFNILAFGHWSPNKRLPLLLEAYTYMEDNVNLIVAGSSHPDYPDYLDHVKEVCDTRNVDFRGYIAEENISDLFAESDLAVLPYKVSVGTSGVLNLAMGYGLPVLATETEALKKIGQEENAELVFCEDSPNSIAETVNRIKNNGKRLEHIAEKNHDIAKEKSIESTSKQILSEINELLE